MNISKCHEIFRKSLSPSFNSLVAMAAIFSDLSFPVGSRHQHLSAMDEEDFEEQSRRRVDQSYAAILGGDGSSEDEAHTTFSGPVRSRSPTPSLRCSVKEVLNPLSIRSSSML